MMRVKIFAHASHSTLEDTVNLWLIKHTASMRVHDQLIDNIKTRWGKWSTAWVIGGYADKFKRERIANDIGAELIFMDVSKEECYMRLEQDERLLYRKPMAIVYRQVVRAV